MSFSRANPGNWAPGAKVLSGQLNTIDTNQSNAVDKTGDTLAGVLHLAGAGVISADLANAIVATVAQAIVSSHVGGIQPGVAGGITSGGVAGGIAASNSGGIVSNAAAGITPTVLHGITDGGIAGGIAATVLGGIVAAVLGGIAAGIAGGIADGGFVGGIAATVPGGVKILDNVQVLGAVASYTVDSAVAGVPDDVVYAPSGTACAITLPIAPILGRRLLLVFPTVAASGAAGAGGSINSNGAAIRLSGVISGPPGTYPATPASAHNLTYDLRYALSGWVQVNGQV